MEFELSAKLKIIASRRGVENERINLNININS